MSVLIWKHQPRGWTGLYLRRLSIHDSRLTPNDCFTSWPVKCYYLWDGKADISWKRNYFLFTHNSFSTSLQQTVVLCRIIIFLQIATFYFFLFYYFLFINLSFENGHNAIFIFMFLYTFYVWILLFYDGPKNTNFHSLTMTIYYYWY